MEWMVDSLYFLNVLFLSFSIFIHSIEMESMSQLMHPFHLLLTRHVIPLLLADAQHLHLLLSTHCSPFQNIVAFGTRKLYFTVTLNA